MPSLTLFPADPASSDQRLFGLYVQLSYLAQELEEAVERADVEKPRGAIQTRTRQVMGALEEGVDAWRPIPGGPQHGLLVEWIAMLNNGLELVDQLDPPMAQIIQDVTFGLAKASCHAPGFQQGLKDMASKASPTGPSIWLSLPLRWPQVGHSWRALLHQFQLETSLPVVPSSKSKGPRI